MSPSLLLMTLASTVAFVAAVLHLAPDLSRPDLFFAVTVDPAFRATPEAGRIRRAYRVRVWIHAGVATLVALQAARSGWPLLAVASMLWPVAAGLLAFVRARGEALARAVPTSTVREAVLGARPRPPAAALQAGPFLVLAATAAVLAWRWADLPERFPVHWNMAGDVDSWGTRTPAGVYGPLVTGAVVCLVLLVLVRLMATQTRRVQPAYDDRVRQAAVGITLATAHFIALVCGATALLPLWRASAPPWPLLAPPFALLAVLAAVLVRLARTVRALPAASAGTAPVGDRTPDSRWKWGLFYFDAEDPALLVAKRFGLGYTLNFANRWSWALLALLVLIPAVAALLG